MEEPNQAGFGKNSHCNGIQGGLKGGDGAIGESDRAAVIIDLGRGHKA